MICKHIALFVPDLRAAEDFYVRVLGMNPLFRESDVDGEESWLRCPQGKGGRMPREPGSNLPWSRSSVTSSFSHCSAGLQTRNR